MAEPSPAALLVEAFANTIDVEEGTDQLAGLDGLRAFLTGAGLPAEVDERDLRQARLLRAGLRERLLASNGEEPDEEVIAQAEEVLDYLPVTVRISAEQPLRAENPLAVIAAAWAHTAATGEWQRLKRCPNHACAWVFWDGTRSRTRRWCSMRVCGNRAKVRAHAERQRMT
ncbi:CGNR zinc finger domain-containing protein [Nonomuraea typhae]|uniref:CGNR zinc finger domain-containing protein n=1 Tax=Nonomuraea typhae TaxID=2603600 RepID=UPI0012F96D79|nr:CGNR zinc finger domain-containing protein [Nonomuraea typhae]